MMSTVMWGAECARREAPLHCTGAVSGKARRKVKRGTTPYVVAKARVPTGSRLSSVHEGVRQENTKRIGTVLKTSMQSS